MACDDGYAPSSGWAVAEDLCRDVTLYSVHISLDRAGDDDCDDAADAVKMPTSKKLEQLTLNQGIHLCYKLTVSCTSLDSCPLSRKWVDG